MAADEESRPGRARGPSGRGNRNAVNEKSESTQLIDDDKSINIEHIAGVIETDEIARLKKLIFRATKGKAYMYVQQFQDESDVKRGPMSVYIILF